MEKIPSTRSTWVKKELDFFKETYEDLDAIQIRAYYLKEKVVDHKNFVCSFSKTTSKSAYCQGSKEIIAAIGRDEPLKPLDTPGKGSCWAISFLLATIGRHNQRLVYGLRLACLVYLINNERKICEVCEERDVYFDFVADILDLTSHTAIRKRTKSKKYTIEESEGY